MQTNTAATKADDYVRRVSTKRANLNVRSDRIWLDEGSRERVERLHRRVSTGLGLNPSLSVLVRVALADLEKRVRSAVPASFNPGLQIPSNAVLELKVALFTAARGEL